jgi:hypothetical protein
MAVVMATSFSSNQAVAQPNAKCEAIYQSIKKDPRLLTHSDRAQHLERDGASCMGTGMYDVWLGAEYLDAGDHQNASLRSCPLPLGRYGFSPTRLAPCVASFQQGERH